MPLECKAHSSETSSANHKAVDISNLKEKPLQLDIIIPSTVFTFRRPFHRLTS